MRSGIAILMGGVLLAGAAAGCAARRAGDQLSPEHLSQKPPVISRVGVQPKVLNHPGQPVRVQCHLSESAFLTVDWVDDAGRIIRRLDAGQKPAGLQQVVWDGRSDDGNLAESGVYRYMIRAKSVHEAQAIWNPSAQMSRSDMEPREFIYDAQDGTFSWLMPRAGYARLRIGLLGFPHLRTLLDWEPLEAGRQKFRWDGRDAPGLMQLQEHPNLDVKLRLFSMAPNTVIIHSGVPRQVVSEGPAEYAPAWEGQEEGFLHARHPRTQCHEAEFKVEFLKVQSMDAQGRPMLKGTVPVRVTIDEEDAARMVNSRFEIAFFEDTQVLFEEEESSNPYTFLWDTSKLPPGEHLLTVNILSYDDHFGVKTVQAVIEEAA